jgi:hypothetical protein
MGESEEGFARAIHGHPTIQSLETDTSFHADPFGILATLPVLESAALEHDRTVSDMALHFLDRHDLICLKVSSKWELCRPTSGKRKWVDDIVTVFKTKEIKLATVVLRASTTSVLNDLGRAADDGVQAIAAAATDGRLAYGGGAVDMALSLALQKEKRYQVWSSTP